jgi:rhodanese-related sulfurtransferase
MNGIDLHEFSAPHAAGGFVIDVREPEEYVAGHLPGARSMPLSRLGSIAAQVPGGWAGTGRPIVAGANAR